MDHLIATFLSLPLMLATPHPTTPTIFPSGRERKMGILGAMSHGLIMIGDEEVKGDRQEGAPAIITVNLRATGLT